jgi:hypothetical protein
MRSLHPSVVLWQVYGPVRENVYGTYGTTTFPGIQTALAQPLDESNEHDKMMQKSNNGQQCSMRYG